jgi:transformation/transcription domain-associated protein
MLSYLAFVMRVLGETDESYGQTLILSALRMLQDCPTNGISLRKVSLSNLTSGCSAYVT